MTNRIFRYEVPVDGRWHIVTSGPVLHVGCRDEDFVEFWADAPEEGVVAETRHFRVFGTGHPMPDGLVYVGTAVAPGDRYVWHLVSDPWKVMA